MSFVATPGVVVDGAYRLEFPLGQGGFGAVWRAVELGSDRRVAVKFLRRGFDRVDLTRFEREAEALRRIRHPNCVELIAFGFADEAGGAYLVADYIEGETLAAWRTRPHTLDEILAVGSQLASALDAAQRAGVIHRDLKPANVMIVGTPSGPHARVLDFGLSRMRGVRDVDVTKTGDVVGTPGYMSPEQLRGARDVGSATDIYCLGVILWELIEGRPLFSGETALQVAMQHLVAPVPPLTQPVAPALGSLIQACLQKEPRRRPSAYAVWRDLELVAGRPAPVRPGRTHHSDLEPSRRRRHTTAAVFLTALAATGIATVLIVPVLRPTPGPAPAPQVIVPPSAPEAPPRPAKRTPERTEAISAPQQPNPRWVAQRPSAGCGSPVPEGPLVADSGEVVLPTRYATDRAHPLLIAFAEHEQRPQQLLRELSFDGLSDSGVVLFAPDGASLGPTGTKWDRARRARTWEQVGELRRRLCIDENRIFLLGHGTGGIAAQQMPCEVSPVAGVVLHAYRMWAGRQFVPDGETRAWMRNACRTPSPLLAIFPMHAASQPVAGGDACFGSGRKAKWAVSLGEQEGFYAELNDCDLRERVREAEFEYGYCESWDCRTYTRTCHVDGGPHFPGYTEAKAPCPEPDGKPFPHEDVVRAFMETVTPREPVLERDEPPKAVKEHDGVKGEVP